MQLLLHEFAVQSLTFRSNLANQVMLYSNQAPQNLTIKLSQKLLQRVNLLSICSFDVISDPQPDVAWALLQAAICVQNVGVHVSCSSHVCTQLAAFFIDPRAEWSTTRGWFFSFYIFLLCFNIHFYTFAVLSSARARVHLSTRHKQVNPGENHALWRLFLY